MSKEEHQILKNFQPSVVFIPSGNRVADIVIEETLYLLQPLIQQFEISIIEGIPTLFDLLGKCFDFNVMFKILEDGLEKFLNRNEKHLSELVKLENKYLLLDDLAIFLMKKTF